MRDAFEQFFDGALQPNENGAGLAQQREILRLRGGAAAEGNDARFLLSAASPTMRWSWACSILRNSGSPSLENISGMDCSAASTMRLSRSTCCQPIWRPSSRATVDLPLPMKPIRQTSGADGASVVMAGFCVENGLNQSIAEWLQSVTFENIDCTIEGSHLNLGAAFIKSAEESVAPLR